jgi:hypothetical protein
MRKMSSTRYIRSRRRMSSTRYIRAEEEDEQHQVYQEGGGV